MAETPENNKLGTTPEQHWQIEADEGRSVFLFPSWARHPLRSLALPWRPHSSCPCRRDRSQGTSAPRQHQAVTAWTQQQRQRRRSSVNKKGQKPLEQTHACRTQNGRHARETTNWAPCVTPLRSLALPLRPHSSCPAAEGSKHSDGP